MIEVVVDDLAFVEADAILRPADDTLAPLTPAMKRLDLQAGARFAALCQVQSPLDAGAAVVTGGGDLSAPLVVHLVLQDADGSGGLEVIRRALRSAWQQAAAWQLERIAAPLIGVGPGRLSIEDAAELLGESFPGRAAGSGRPTSSALSSIRTRSGRRWTPPSGSTAPESTDGRDHHLRGLDRVARLACPANLVPDGQPARGAGHRPDLTHRRLLHAERGRTAPSASRRSRSTRLSPPSTSPSRSTFGSPMPTRSFASSSVRAPRFDRSLGLLGVVVSRSQSGERTEIRATRLGDSAISWQAGPEGRPGRADTVPHAARHRCAPVGAAAAGGGTSVAENRDAAQG